MLPYRCRGSEAGNDQVGTSPSTRIAHAGGMGSVLGMIRTALDLRASIDHCYALFAAYPRPDRLEAAPCRDGDAILRTLRAAPLAELTSDQIGAYAGYAMTTVGDADAYRYVLPRILELASGGADWLGLEPPMIAGKLQLAAWRSWPIEQQDAISTFMLAAFEAALSRHPEDGAPAADWLCARCLLGEPPQPAFALWLSTPSPMAALQLAAFVLDEARKIRRYGDVRGGFWDDVEFAARQDVARLLDCDDVIDALDAASSCVSAEDSIKYLEPALTRLKRQW